MTTVLWCPVSLAKLRLLLSSSFFPKRAIGTVSTDLGSWIALQFQFNFFRPNTSEMQSFQPSFLFIPIQQKKIGFCYLLWMQDQMTCWTHGFMHSDFEEFFNESKRDFSLFVVVSFVKNLYVLRYLCLWLKFDLW